MARSTRRSWTPDCTAIRRSRSRARVAEADRLIATAAERGVRFLCAPGVAVTTRFRWLAELDRLRALRPSDPRGDPPCRSGTRGLARVHGRPDAVLSRRRRPGVRPWRLPAPRMTMLLGPVTRVQAMGAIATPTRVVRGGPLTGQVIEVTTPDHVLINLEFASGALGQLLASFGTAELARPVARAALPDGDGELRRTGSMTMRIRSACTSTTTVRGPRRAGSTGSRSRRTNSPSWRPERATSSTAYSARRRPS